MDDYSLRGRAKGLITARNWGIALIGSALGFGIFLTEIKRVWDEISTANIAYLGLFLITCILIFLWVWCSQKEFDLCFEWMDPIAYSPPNALKETTILVGLALLLVVLVFASRNPIIYGAVFTAYSITVMLSVIYFNRQLKTVIKETRDRYQDTGESKLSAELAEARKTKLSGLATLEEYFIKRPHTQRHIIIVCVSLAGLFFAILGRAFNNTALEVASYITYSATIIISEMVIGHWRNVRDQRIRECTTELHRLRYEREKNSQRDKMA